jgi:hypothetical protein
MSTKSVPTTGAALFNANKTMADSKDLRSSFALHVSYSADKKK